MTTSVQESDDAPAPGLARVRHRRRALVVVASGVVLAAGFAVAVRLGGDAGEQHQRQAGDVAEELPESPSPEEQPSQPPPPGRPATAPSLAYSPQPGRRFVVVGTNTRDQFTDEQLRFLAENFDVVQFTKFHAGFEIRRHHEAARSVVALRPGIEVYPYFSAKHWFDNNRWDGAVIDPRWLLRDNDGNLVERDKRREGEERTVSTYIDLSNPEYRAWALGVLSSWLSAAPYAGIYFDAASPIGGYEEDEIEKWDELLGRERIAEYNAGLRELLASAKKLVGPNRNVLFNGIAASPKGSPERNLSLLELTDGAVNERFCLNVRGQLNANEEDLVLLAERRDKRLFMRTGYKTSLDQGARLRWERYCLGLFLLGWEPGRSYFQFNADYGAGQLAGSNPDVNVNLGRPVGPHRRRDDLGEREFEHGAVYVNLGAKALNVDVRAPLTEVRGGQVVRSLRPGAAISVPPHDAVFVLHSHFLGEASP